MIVIGDHQTTITRTTITINGNVCVLTLALCIVVAQPPVDVTTEFWNN